MLALLQVTTPLSASGQSPHTKGMLPAEGVTNVDWGRRSGVNCSWSVLSLVHFGQNPTHFFVFFLRKDSVMKKERISVKS